MRRLLSIVLVAAAATPALAQGRTDFSWSKALAAGSRVSVSNINGDIRIVPSTSGKVEVTGVKRGSSGDFDEIKGVARETGRGVEICVVPADHENDCDGDSDHRWHGRSHWDDVRMDLEVRVPANLTVSAQDVSGDVSIDGAQGDIHAGSVSGDVRMSHLRASSLDASSVSGDVTASLDALTGRGDLRFQTVSGDVTLNVPSPFNADLSMQTVSGDVDSDFPLTLQGGHMSRRRVEARIGNGGRRLDLQTVSGDVKIRKN
ncbi:MAG TPA: DUF4097 family beta strand repeat-containing protein [Gemmatimonadaceae bacterium]|nr:DUF4097 family beta strand repeat-containing protein [Gemmatimonadaceae bacterium]